MHAPFTPAPPENQLAVRAELKRSDRCSALGIEVRSAAPVLLLCRKLVAAGYDPATPLEAYRGDMLCLKIRTIGDPAGFEINAKGTGLIPFRAVRMASPMRQTAPEAL